MPDYFHIIRDDECREPHPAKGARGRWGEDYPTATLVAACTVLAIALSIQGFLIYVMVDGLNTDQAGFETNSTEFSLYKNTMAAECYLNDTIPIPGLCSSLSRHLVSESLEGRQTFLAKREYVWNDTQSTLNATWCQVLHCVQDFKVLPSQVLPFAYWSNRFASWSSGNSAAVTYLVTFTVYLRGRRNDRWRHCRGLKSLGVLDWITTLYAFVGAFGWWWISILRGWRNNTDASTASFAAWTVMWYQAYNLHYQPRSCALASLPRKMGKVIKGTAWLLVAAQCAATAYFVIDWDFAVRALAISSLVARESMPRQAYGCLESSIASAPGFSSCTPDYLCSPDKEWVLQRRDFQQDDGIFFGSIFPPLHFILSTLVIAGHYAFVLLRCLLTWDLRNIREQMRKQEEVPLYLMALVACLSLFFSIVNIVMVARNGGETGMDERYASVALNAECSVIHVGVSPWKHFLDIDSTWRDVWLAQAWMNG
ncbi:hypothetical protein B0I35DRAFT_484655 [Stachybotrys elegans]|uniref:Uncharacterized protein n=1 Tax=Stachybotrys elegans TaxID=80388 RepID=A0A8K0SEM7_9HYPO|nr:hypothetical protein B0I35DRAFT_484655 [Stachybotrys elegans]